MASNESAAPATTTSGPPNPSEVGWQFVPQYYTFVNKHPNRLHCFYTKESTFVHGTEGEDLKTCHGQQEIHSFITSIGFQDCKVFIDCVDAQASSNGGIVVQVIGEMSNNGEPWRKFVQTFFLAEQPNGYYVLNDIFRFLKEDVPEEENGDTQEPTADEIVADVPEVSATHAEEPSAPVVPEPEPEPEPEVEAEAEMKVEEPPHVNGHAEESAPEAVASADEPAPTPLPEEQGPVETVETTATIAEVPASAASTATLAAPAPPVAAPPPAVSPAPQQQPTPAATPTPAAAAPTPPPATPAGPKTWANLAATNSKKWGSAVASDSRGTSEAPPPPPPSQRPLQPGGGGMARSAAPPPRPNVGDKDQNPLYAAVMASTTPQCFVKGIVDPLTNEKLEQELTTRFGPLKEIEIVRSKACAFLEFNTLEAARRAMLMSLPMGAGGNGGVHIDCGGGNSVRISVETRKERGDRPPSRPRGGGPPNSDRGSFRGRGSIRGRGIPPSK